MTLKKKTLLASLTLAIVFLPACTRRAPPPGPGQGVGQQDQRVFSISLYTDPAHPDQCYADWPQATLWKDNHQTVKWISDDGKDYVVDFSLGKYGSPFADPSPKFPVPANGVKASGDLSQSSLKGRYYDYGIWAGTNNKVPCKPASDPGLYVK
jgi:hypothetical protein